MGKQLRISNDGKMKTLGEEPHDGEVCAGHKQFFKSVSKWDRFLVLNLAIFYGLWTILKICFRLIWNANTSSKQILRDVPPKCLVDSALGHHKFVKLKVGNSILKKYSQTCCWFKCYIIILFSLDTKKKGYQRKIYLIFCL